MSPRATQLSAHCHRVTDRRASVGGCLTHDTLSLLVKCPRSAGTVGSLSGGTRGACASGKRQSCVPGRGRFLFLTLPSRRKEETGEEGKCVRKESRRLCGAGACPEQPAAPQADVPGGRALEKQPRSRVGSTAGAHTRAASGPGGHRCDAGGLCHAGARARTPFTRGGGVGRPGSPGEGAGSA